MTKTISLCSQVDDPSWKHPTIDYERGFGDATRGLPKRARQSNEYEMGHVDGLAWSKKVDPMRFQRKETA